MKTKIGIPAKSVQSVAEILEATLADEMVLLVKTRNFHWNITGPDFGELHKFLDEQYTQLAEYVDEVAERIRTIGEYAPGSMAQFVKLARLKENQQGKLKAREMLAELLADHQTLIRSLREDLDSVDKHGDAGTSDYLTGLMEAHEKMAWMLRSYLEE